MISVDGIGTKEYWAVFGDVSTRPVVRCPDARCEGSAADPHGHHVRYVGGELRPIYRVLCPGCGVTHGVLPEDICAYRDLTLGQLERVVEAAGPSEGAGLANLGGVDTTRRSRRLRQAAERGLARAVEAFLTAGEGNWLERTRGLASLGVDALLWLRRWLVSLRQACVTA